MNRSCAREARTLSRWLPRLTPPWAWSVWGLLAVLAVAIVLYKPRTVTHNYREACRAWFAGAPIYQEGVHGFLYLPQAAILFAPFTYLAHPWGELLWRVVGIGIFATAGWRLALLLGQRARPSLFSLVTLFAIPTALSSARNGQMNLVLVAMMTLAFVSLATRRWNTAVCWLCLGVALKPLMAVPIVVAVVAYPRVLRPLAVGLIVVALSPFATQHPSYVVEQYNCCLEKLLSASQPGAANPHADLFGLVSSLGWQAPMGVQTATRTAALALLPLVCLWTRRRRNSARTALVCLTLTAAYLTLFNPRAENNSYVLLAPSLGGLAAVGLVRDHRRAVGWLMALAVFGIAGSYELSGGPNFWLSPLMSSLVLVYVVGEIVAGRRRPRRARQRVVPRPRPAGVTVTPSLAAVEGAVQGDHDLTVVIPAYNEAARLPATLTALACWLEAWGVDYRVLVVDDGSDDGTARVAGDFGPRFSTLMTEPRGKGAAVRRGVLAATGRVVAFTDADLPYDLRALRTAYEWVCAGRCEVVFGARDVPGAANHAPRRLTRSAASFAFRRLTRRLVSRRVTDTQCGLKVFGKGAARSIFSRTRLDGFAFDAEVVWLCHRLQLPFRRVPVTLVNEYGSSLSVRRHAVPMLFDVLRLPWLHRSGDERPIAAGADEVSFRRAVPSRPGVEKPRVAAASAAIGR
ncbi:MAG TPA: glycosyltransferase [Pirellulales bacterium]|nr:glycosyltransferase [Pirellulales bacterium]